MSSPPGASPPASSVKPLTLRVEDHFVRRRTAFGYSVWAVRSRGIVWLASCINLYLLLNAVRALNNFEPLGLEDYAITDLASAAACLQSRALPPAAPPPSPHSMLGSNASSLIESALGTALGAIKSKFDAVSDEIHEVAKKNRADDLADLMRTCRAQLALAEPPGLAEAKLNYWYAAYGCIAAALALDTLRWCGCCSGVTDAVLGYRSRRMERFRLLPQLAMLMPFVHLCWLLSRPIELPCCEGTPKIARVMDKVRWLAWLSLLVTYCLFADSHNHGYFLLRSPSASACRLLRPTLGGVASASSGRPAAAEADEWKV